MLNRIKIGLSLCLLFVAVPAVSAQGWVTLTPAGEGFSVQLPSKPQEEPGRAPILGEEYASKMYTVQDATNRIMFLTVMQEFPAAVATLKPVERLDEFMNGFRESFIKEITATCPNVDVRLDRELKLNDRLGRQYSLNCREIPGLIRVFETERRIYVLVVMGGDEKHDGVSRFLQSFEILPAPAPVPLPKVGTKSSQN